MSINFNKLILLINNLNLLIMKRKLLSLLTAVVVLGLGKLSADPLFDLRTFEGAVPSGCTIDTINGEPFLKVRVDGWNSWFEIAPIEATANTSIQFSYMYDKDTSTNTTPVQAFFQLVSSDWSIKASGTDNPASETVKSISGKLKAGTFTIAQFAVQQTSGSWSAITGPFIYN